MAVILIGIIVITKLNNEQSEDKQLSSGYSLLIRRMDKIDNNANILNYPYVSKKENKQEVSIQHLKDVLFSFWDGEILNDEQYPQGICLTEEYLIVTSYADSKNTFGECKVFDKHTGEHLVTLGMDKKSHLGGISYDGKNIWVCNSPRMEIERISFAFVQGAISNHRGGFVDITNLMEGYRVDNLPSSLFYYDGKLYVSTHTKWNNSKMISYFYDEQKNCLVKTDVYTIPAKVQGVALDDEERVYVSSSYGRENSSYLKIYSSLEDMHRNVNAYIEMIEMPPCSEGLVWEDEKLYILFESAGKKYIEGTDGKGRSVSPLDRILIIDRASP